MKSIVGPAYLAIAYTISFISKAQINNSGQRIISSSASLKHASQNYQFEKLTDQAENPKKSRQIKN